MRFNVLPILAFVLAFQATGLLASPVPAGADQLGQVGTKAIRKLGRLFSSKSGKSSRTTEPGFEDGLADEENGHYNEAGSPSRGHEEWDGSDRRAGSESDDEVDDRLALVPAGPIHSSSGGGRSRSMRFEDRPGRDQDGGPAYGGAAGHGQYGGSAYGGGSGHESFRDPQYGGSAEYAHVAPPYSYGHAGGPAPPYHNRAPPNLRVQIPPSYPQREPAFGSPSIYPPPGDDRQAASTSPGGVLHFDHRGGVLRDNTGYYGRPHESSGQDHQYDYFFESNERDSYGHGPTQYAPHDHSSYGGHAGYGGASFHGAPAPYLGAPTQQVPHGYPPSSGGRGRDDDYTYRMTY